MNSTSNQQPSAFMRILSWVAGVAATRKEGRPVDLHAARRTNDTITERLMRSPKGVTMRDETISGVPIVRFSSNQTSGPQTGDAQLRTSPGTVLYIHGGAYVMGSAKQGASYAYLSKEHGPDVVSVEYRLAPEHPFPAAVDDAIAVYQALVNSEGADRIVVIGESAGGGLALLMLQRARDEGLALPAGVITAFPWADLTLSGPSTRDNLGKDMLSRSELVEEAGWFAAGRSTSDALVSPLFGSFHGFPRTYLPVGTHDILLDDARRVAAAMKKDGVDITLDEYPGAIHGFTALPVREGRQYKRRLHDFIHASLATSKPQPDAPPYLPYPTYLPPFTAPDTSSDTSPVTGPATAAGNTSDAAGTDPASERNTP